MKFRYAWTAILLLGIGGQGLWTWTMLRWHAADMEALLDARMAAAEQRWTEAFRAARHELTAERDAAITRAVAEQYEKLVGELAGEVIAGALRETVVEAVGGDAEDVVIDYGWQVVIPEEEVAKGEEKDVSGADCREVYAKAISAEAGHWGMTVSEWRQGYDKALQGLRKTTSDEKIAAVREFADRFSGSTLAGEALLALGRNLWITTDDVAVAEPVLREVMEKYSHCVDAWGTPLAAKALFILGNAFGESGRDQDARDCLTALRQEYADVRHWAADGTLAELLQRSRGGGR